MALLWVDGFEKYGPTGGTIQPTNILDWKYFGSFDERIDIVTGSTGNAIRIDNVSTYLCTPILTSNRTLVCGFAFQYPTAFTNDQWLVGFRKPNFFGYVVGYTELQLQIDTSCSVNGLEVLRNGSLIESTDNTLDLQTGTWYYLEMKCYCDKTNGTLEVKIDGNTVLTYNGDTQSDTEYDYYSAVLFRANKNEPWYLDDLYICDGSGNTNNDFLGSCNVYTLSPNADISNNWTLSTGSDAYALLDEDEQGSDNVSSNTSGNKCQVSMGTYNATGTIAGVMVNCEVGANVSHGSFNKYVKLGTYNGAGTVNTMGACAPGVDGIVLNSCWIMEKNADGDDWDSSTINSLRVEVEVV